MFFIGIDLGQKRDHTAIAVVERVEAWRPYGPSEFRGLDVRWLERVPLGTAYPVVVERVRQMVRHAELEGNCSVTVDGTGVGTPVVDLLRTAGLRCELIPVTITGGEKESANGSGWNVPKRDLIATLQVLLEKNELRVAKELEEAGSLVRELLDVKSRETGGGKARLGAEGTGEHDDLVIALALACWRARKWRSMQGGGRLNGI